MLQPLPPLEQLAAICRRYRLNYLALFGSALRPDFGPESDVDILIDFAPDARIGMYEYVGLRDELSALFNRPVDLVDRVGLKWVIRQAVLESAQVLYEG